jgi:hypothetical protein
MGGGIMVTVGDIMVTTTATIIRNQKSITITRNQKSTIIIRNRRSAITRNRHGIQAMTGVPTKD